MKRQKQTRKHLKLISFLLVLCLSVAVLFSAPMTVSAEEIDSGHTPESNNATTVEDVAAGITSVENLYENGYELPVTDTAATSNGKPTPIQRLYSEEPNDLYTQVWLNNDGTRTMRLYDHPVKYVTNDGDIEDISLDVVASTTAVGGYETEAGFAKTVFPSKVTDGISLSGNGVSVKLTPVLPNSALAMDGITANDTVTLVNNQTVSYTYDAKTSLDYKLTYMGFKEDIVVNEYTGQTQYTFMLETNGLTLVNENGSYFLKDETGEIKATLGDIIVFTADERNNTMGELTHTVIKPNNYYFLTNQLDAEWLSDENTAYPIRIDPTVEITSGTGAIEDVTINSNAGSDGSSGSLYVGLRSSAGISRTLMKFPGLNLDNFTSDSIISAVVEIRDLMCESSSMVVDAYAFTGGTWSESTASWSSVNPHSLGLWQDSITVSYSNGATLSPTHRYEIDFTSAMLNWKSGRYDKNMGIILKADSPNVEYGSTYIHKTFASYNRSSYKPSLAITYRDANVPVYAVGSLDNVKSTYIRGWTYRSDVPNTPINVKIDITNSTTGQQFEPIIVLAQEYRPDVQEAGYGNGYHGYYVNIDWGAYTPGTYTVRAYGQNNNGTFKELACSPKTYTVAGYGQPLSDGEYYINNKEHGRYLHNASSTINVASGLLNNLGSTIKWMLQKYSDGYVIMDTNSSKYLCVPSGNYETQNTSSRAVSSGKSVECIWDIVLSDTTGCVLRSRYNGRYLFSDGNTVYTSPEIGAANTSNRYTKTWRIVSTSVYGNSVDYAFRELYFNESHPFYVIACIGETQTVDLSFSENILWHDKSDFSLSSPSSTTININSSNLAISGSVAGNYTVRLTHKVTGRYKDVPVYICKYSHTINNYFDDGYCVRYGLTRQEATDYINDFTDVAIRAFAIEHSIKLIRNNATYYQSTLDECKEVVTASNIDQTTCSCGSNPHSFTDNEVADDFYVSHPYNKYVSNVLWSGHKMVSAADGKENVSYSVMNKGIIMAITIIGENYDYSNISKNMLYHEMCHQFNAKDHYCYEHYTTSDPTRPDCGQEYCIICKEDLNQYSKDCIMYSSYEIYFDFDSDYGYTDASCPGCKTDIANYLESR